MVTDFMVYLKWLGCALADIALMPYWYASAIVISIFTTPEKEYVKGATGYTWGGLSGTYDNLPRGDEKWQREGWFPNVITGFKGYLNRIGWLWRNPGYNWQRKVGIPYDASHALLFTGDEHISDKYKRSGYYFAKLYDRFDLVGFEFYCVYPWGFGKCLRVRLGYKLMTDKFQRYRFAPLVDTINPFKSYGD